MKPKLLLVWLVFASSLFASERRTISALGKLIPGEGIIYLQASMFSQETPVIEALLVREGDAVTKGQLLATTRHRAVAEAMVKLAAAQLDEAKSKLELVEAGEEKEEVAAQIALVASLDAQFRLEQTVFKRRERLSQANAVASEEVDTVRLEQEIADQRLDQAKKKLEAMNHVRPEDVRIAKATIACAEAELKRVEALAALTEIRAPVDGRVLSIEVQGGESPGPAGVLALGQPEEMQVEAEVFAADLGQVQVGSRAEVTGDAFPGALQGRVSRVEPLIRSSRLRPTDPRVSTDNRVARVTVKLDDASKLGGSSNAEVVVTFPGD